MLTDVMMRRYWKQLISTLLYEQNNFTLSVTVIVWYEQKWMLSRFGLNTIFCLRFVQLLGDTVIGSVDAYRGRLQCAGAVMPCNSH